MLRRSCRPSRAARTQATPQVEPKAFPPQYLRIPQVLAVDPPDPVAEQGPVKGKSTQGSDEEDRDQRPYRCSVHAFECSPPNRHSVEVLMLWGHKAPLCPSYASDEDSRPAGRVQRGNYALHNRHQIAAGGRITPLAGRWIATKVGQRQRGNIIYAHPAAPTFTIWSAVGWLRVLIEEDSGSSERLTTQLTNNSSPNEGTSA
jgi:hypothetical protein